MNADKKNKEKRVSATMLKPAESAVPHQGMTAASPRVAQLHAYAAIANGAPVAQRQAAQGGLPSNLKTGIESLSGMAMDDVRVHYNSSKPAQLQAHAFAQGSDIHIASGQEKHLPHEAWHVVQQKQGRVKPTLQLKGVAINDSSELEREADVMGARALSNKSAGGMLENRNLETRPVAQLARKVGLFGIEAEVMGERFHISAPKEAAGGKLVGSELVSLEEYSLGVLGGRVDVTLDNEVTGGDAKTARRHYTVEFIQHAVDPMDNVAATLKAWQDALVFWQSNIDGKTEVLKGGEAMDGYATTPTWMGGQFDHLTDQPGVTKQVDEDGKFDWRNAAYTSYIDAKTPDPQVSMQLTFGSTLLGLAEAYYETLPILSKAAVADEKEMAAITTHQRNSALNPEAHKLTAFILLIQQLVDSQDGHNKRYAKEYVSLMSRTSLDQVYGQMSPRLRVIFQQMVGAYIQETPGNNLAKYLKRRPNERLFRQPSGKEDAANAITIADLLLSITKQHYDEEQKAFVNDAEAKSGDVLSQNGLAGMSEINPQSEENIAKFGLTAANQMMRNVEGLIVESRAATPMPLSKVPVVFSLVAATLKGIQDKYDVAEARKEAILKQEAVKQKALEKQKTAENTKSSCVIS